MDVVLVCVVCSLSSSSCFVLRKRLVVAASMQSGTEERQAWRRRAAVIIERGDILNGSTSYYRNKGLGFSLSRYVDTQPFTTVQMKSKCCAVKKYVVVGGWRILVVAPHFLRERWFPSPTSHHHHRRPRRSFFPSASFVSYYSIQPCQTPTSKPDKTGAPST